MANRPLDLLGMKFNMLTPTAAIRKGGRVYWECQCDCGGTTTLVGSRIKSGAVKSCGCLATASKGVIDIAGQRFGRLTAVKMTGGRRGSSVEWECTCDCGGTMHVSSAKLREGATRSCGCYRTDVHTTHGMSSTPEYSVWSAMKDRCYNEKCNRWHTHGARGIGVCGRWINNFANFMGDMGPRPTSKHSLERVNNDGDYGPENCVWATDREQAENRRTTRKFTHLGKTQSLKAWCRDIGIPYVRAYKRIVYRGWSFEEAIK